MNKDKGLLYICPGCKREVEHLHPMEFKWTDASVMRCDDCIDTAAAESQTEKNKENK